MPRSLDNQDLPDNPETEKKENDKENTPREKGHEDENNFTSDNLTGKKVDADLEKDSDKPAEVQKD